ncbi:MAG: hypothetical protein JRM97_06225 [Nitrososphaerota archaeon]|jgi:hypothetical protein|nr:hypothetical protein [Ferrimicrobium acidiphilum]MDG6981081.1 hypothetical protein [Nitrososphaerota archaeon]MDG7032207.1 hypothetical protein [Nitrososphaerota archaeon]
MQQYFAVLGNRRRNDGIISANSYRTAPAACRAFLDYLGIRITTNALSELIAQTKKQHKKDNMDTNDAILRFASLPPVPQHSTLASFVKGVFRSMQDFDRLTREMLVYGKKYSEIIIPYINAGGLSNEQLDTALQLLSEHYPQVKSCFPLNCADLT